MEDKPTKQSPATRLVFHDAGQPSAPHCTEIDALKAENQALRDALNARHKSMSTDTRERLRKS